MTNEEVIDALEMMIGYVDWEYPLDYSAALDEAIKAVKKQTPRKLKNLKHFRNAAKGYGVNTDVLTGACPFCGRIITQDYVNIFHCPVCGQGLDWS